MNRQDLIIRFILVQATSSFIAFVKISNYTNPYIDK